MVYKYKIIKTRDDILGNEIFLKNWELPIRVKD